MQVFYRKCSLLDNFYSLRIFKQLSQSRYQLISNLPLLLLFLKRQHVLDLTYQKILPQKLFCPGVV